MGFRHTYFSCLKLSFTNYIFLYRVILTVLHVSVGHAVVQLVEALRYMPEGCRSIPDGVIENFYRHNPSGHTVALGSTQPLTVMSTRDVSWGVKAAGV